MADGTTVAGALLVANALGAVPIAHPQLTRVWSAPREEFARIVAEHRRAWAWLNAGFIFATVMTAAGLAALSAGLGGDPARTAALAAVAVAYAIAGSLWCAVVAIRTRTMPALFDSGVTNASPAPPEILLEAATGAMFAAFVLATGAVLVALGGTLALSGGVTLPAALTAIVGVLAIAMQLTTGDFIPAVLYLLTLVIGIALLAGWS
jgi:hypothetical protein